MALLHEIQNLCITSALIQHTVGDLRGTDAREVAPWQFLPGHLAQSPVQEAFQTGLITICKVFCLRIPQKSLFSHTDLRPGVPQFDFQTDLRFQLCQLFRLCLRRNDRDLILGIKGFHQRMHIVFIIGMG